MKLRKELEIGCIGQHLLPVSQVNTVKRARKFPIEDALAILLRGAFFWAQSRIRIIGIMRVSVWLGAILIPEYLDFHSGYFAPGSRIAGIYSGIYPYPEYPKRTRPRYFTLGLDCSERLGREGNTP